MKENSDKTATSCQGNRTLYFELLMWLWNGIHQVGGFSYIHWKMFWNFEDVGIWCWQVIHTLTNLIVSQAHMFVEEQKLLFTFIKVLFLFAGITYCGSHCENSWQSCMSYFPISKIRCEATVAGQTYEV